MRQASWAALCLWTACKGPNPLFWTSAGEGSSGAASTSATTAGTGAGTSPTSAPDATSTGVDASGSATLAVTATGEPDSGTGGGSTGGSTGEGSTGESTGGMSLVTCPNDPALVGCYHFPAGELGQLVDGSQHENHGVMTIEGLVAAPPGFEQAAALGPASAPVVHEDGAKDSLDVVAAITMTALVRLADLPATGRVGILDKDGQYSLFVHPDGGLRCQVADFIEPTGVVVPVGAWVHVACSFDGATIRVYLDGVEKAAIPKFGALQSDVLGDLVLGGNSPLPADRMIGELDAVEIWATALAPAAICERAGPVCP